MSKRRSKWIALLLLFALVAASCGSDDGETGTAETPAEEPATTDAPAEEPATTDAPEEEPATTDAPAEEPEEPANTDPIKIGALTSLSGPFTSWGIPSSTGMQLAVDEINAAGGVDGRMLELIIVDDQSNPEEAVLGFERLLEDGVVAVAGTISSGVGLATTAIAEEEQVPLFLSKAGSAAILTTDSRYTFRTCLPAAPMIAAPWAQYAGEQGFSKIGVIIADYEWGQSFQAAVESEFAGLDGVDVQVEVAPVPEKDFTTYLRSLTDFEPELLLGTGHPPGVGAIMVQSADLGFDIGITGPSSSLSAVMEGAGDVAIDRYLDYSCADYFSDDYQDLARRYIANSDQGFMEDDAVAGFGVVTMVADAISNVGDDPAAIAEYLHGETYDLPGYAFEMGWTEWGELATSQPLIIGVSEGPAPDGVNELGDWYPERLFLSDPLEPFVP